VLFPIQNLAAKGSSAPAGVENRAQDGSEQGLCKAAGLSRQIPGRG